MSTASIATFRAKLALTTALVGGVLGIGAARPAFAQALPTAADVVGIPSVSAGGLLPLITNPDANTLQVGLNATGTIIEWNGFNVPTGTAANFSDTRLVPTGNIAVLNRDVNTGGAPSLINGSLTTGSGNISVYLINTNGITFGTGANVNVGALVASTLNNASDADFLAGNANLKFTGAPDATGGVRINDGTFAIRGDADADLGQFVLLGAFVEQSGATLPAASDVAFVAGTDITMTNTPGSPLAFTIDRGTTVHDAITVGGTISGRNVTLALARAGSVADAILNVTGVVTATVATPSDRGVVLSAGQAVAGAVTLGGAAGATDGAARITGATNTSAIISTGTVTVPPGDPTPTPPGATLAAKSGLDYAGTIIVIGAASATSAAGDVSVGTIRGQTATVTAANGAVSVGQATSDTGDIAISGTGTATVSGAVSAAGNYAVTSSAGDAVIGTLATIIGQTAVGGVTITGATGISALGTLRLTSNANGSANGETTSALRLVTTGAGASIQASDTNFVGGTGDGNGRGRITIEQADAAGSASFGSIFGSSFNSITGGVVAQGLSRAGNLTVTRGVDLLNSFVATSTAGNVQLGGDVTVRGTAQGITLSGATGVSTGGAKLADGDISITGAGAIDAALVTSTNGSVLLRSTGAGVTGSSLSGRTGIIVDAQAGDAGIGSATATGGGVSVSASGTAEVRFGVTAGAGDYSVSGANVVLGSTGSGAVQSSVAAVLVSTGAAGSITGRSGLTLTSNSDGAGADVVRLGSGTGGISFDTNTSIVGGTAADRSNLQIRQTALTDTVALGDVTALGLQSAIGTDPFANGITRSGALSFGTVNLVNSFVATSTASSVTVAGVSVSGAGQGIALDAATTLTAPGTIIADGDVSLIGGNALNFTSVTSTSGNALVRSTGAGVTVGAIVSGIASTVDAQGGNVSLGTANAGAGVGVSGTGTADVTGSVTAAGGAYTVSGTSVTLGDAGGVAVTQRSNDLVTITATDAAGTITGRAGLILTGNSDNIGNNPLTLASGSGGINFAAGTQINGSLNQTSDVLVGNADAPLTLGNVTARGLIGSVGTRQILRSSTITIGTINVAESLDLRTTGAATINTGTITATPAGANVSLTSVAALVAPTISAGGNVTLISSANGVTSTNGIGAGGALAITGQDVVLGGTISAGGAADITSNSVAGIVGNANLVLTSNSDGSGAEALTLTNGVANGAINLAAGSSLVGGTAGDRSDIQIRTVNGASALTLGNVTGRGLLGAIGAAGFTNGLSRAGSIQVGAVDLVSTLSLTSTAGNVSVGAVTVRGVGQGILLSANAGALTLPSTLTANGNVSLSALSAITLNSVTSSAGTASLVTGNGAITATTVNGATGATLTAGGPNAVNVDSVDAGTGPLAITAAALNGRAAGTRANLTAGGAVTLDISGAALLDGVTGGSVTLTNATSGDARSVTATTGPVALNAGTLIIGSVDAATAATLTATGTATVTGDVIARNGAYSISGSSVTLGNADNTTAVTQRATGAVNLTATGAAGTVTGRGGLTVTANSDGTGTEALTFATGTGGIAFAANTLLNGGTAKQSDVIVGTANAPLALGNVTARGLIAATGSRPIVRAGAVTLGTLDLLTSLVVNAGTGITTGGIMIRPAGEGLTLATTAGMVTASGPYTIGGGVLVQGPAGASLGNVVAGGTLQLTATAGAVNAGTLDAGDDITVSAGTTATLGAITTVPLIADVSVTTANDFTAPTVSAGGNVALISTGGRVSVPAMLTAGTAVGAGAGGALLVRGTSVTLGNGDTDVISATGSVTINATGGGTIGGGANLVLRSDGNNTGGDDLTLDTTGTIAFAATSTLNGGAQAIPPSALRIRSGTGTLTVGNVNVLAITDIGGTTLTRSAATVFGDVRSANGVSITTTNGAALTTGAVTVLNAGQDITLNAAGTLTVTNATSTRDLTLRGSTLSAASTSLLTAPRNLLVNATNGALSVRDASAGGTLMLIQAGTGTLTVSGTANSVGNATLMSAGNMLVANASSTGGILTATSTGGGIGGATTGSRGNFAGDAGVTVDARNGNALLDAVASRAGAAAVLASGTANVNSVRASAAASVSGGGGVDFGSIDGGTASATSTNGSVVGGTATGTGGVTVNGRSITLGTGTATGGNVSLTATAGAITLGSASAGTIGSGLARDVVLSATGGGVAVTGNIVAERDFTASGTIVVLGDDAEAETQAAGRNVAISSTGGPIIGGPLLTLNSDADNMGGGNITLNSAGAIFFAPSSTINTGVNPLNGAPTRTGTLTLTQPVLEALTLGTVNAGTIVTNPPGRSGNIVVGNVSTVNALSLITLGSITTGTIDVTGTGQGLTLAAGGPLSAQAINAVGNIVLNSSNSTVMLTTVDSSAGTLSATANGALTAITASAQGNATLTGGSVTLVGGPLASNTLTSRAGVARAEATGGAVTLTALTGATGAQAVATGAVVADTITTASGTAQVQAGGDAGGRTSAQMGINSTGGAVQLTAASANLSSATAGTSLSLTTTGTGTPPTGGNLTLVTGRAGTTALVRAQPATGDVFLTSLIAGGNATVEAGSDVRVTGASSTGGTLSVTATNGQVTGLDPAERAGFSSAGDLGVSAFGLALIDGVTTTGGGTITVEAGTIDALTATTTGLNANLMMTADGGPLTLVTGNIGGSATLLTTGFLSTLPDITVTTLNAGLDLTVISRRAVRLNSVSAGFDAYVAGTSITGFTAPGGVSAGRTATVAGGDVNLGSVTGGFDATITGGTITLSTATANTRALTIVGTGDVTVGTASAGTDAEVRATGSGSSVRADTITATTGAITLVSASGAVTGRDPVAGRTTLSSGTNSIVRAGTLARLNTVSAGGDVGVTAGTDIDLVAASGIDIALNAQGGTVLAPTLTARDDIVIRAAGTIVGSVWAAGSGTAAIDQAGTADLLLGATLTGRNVDVAGSRVTIGTITAPGYVQIGGPVIGGTADGDLSVTSGDFIRFTDAARGRDIALSAAAGRIEVTTIDARDDIALRAAGGNIIATALTSGTTVDGLAAIDVAGVADTLAAGTLDGSDVNGSALGVQIGTIAALGLAGDVTLVSGPNGMTLGSATAGRTIMLTNNSTTAGLTATGTLTAGTDETADVIVASASNATLNIVAASRDIAVRGGTAGTGNVVLANGAARDIALSTPGGAITATTLTARDDIAIRASGAVTGSSWTSGGSGGVDEDGVAEALLAGIDLGGNDIDVGGSTITIGTVRAPGAMSDVRLRGAVLGGTIAGDLDIAAGRDILITGDSGGRDIALNAGRNIQTGLADGLTGAVNARDDIAMRAGGTIVTGVLTSGTSVGGLGPVDVAGVADTLLVGVDLTGNDIDLAGTSVAVDGARALGTGSDVRIRGLVLGGAAGDLDIQTGGDIDLVMTISARDVALRAGGAIRTVDILARDDIAIRAGGAIGTGALTSGATIGGLGPVDVAAAADALLPTLSFAGNDIDVIGGMTTAASVTGGIVTSLGTGSDVRMLAMSGPLTLASVTAGGAAALEARGEASDLTVTSVTAALDASLIAQRNVRLDGATATAGPLIVTATTGDVTGIPVDDAGIRGRTSLTSGAAITINAGGLARLNAVAAQTDLAATAGSIDATMLTATRGGMDLVANAGSITFMRSFVGGATTINAADAIFGVDVSSGGNVTARAGGALFFSTLSSGGSATLDGATTRVTGLRTAGDLTATARNGDLSLFLANVGGRATVATTGGAGDIIVGSAAAGFGSFTSAGTATFTSVGDVRFGDVASTGGDLIVTALAGEVTNIDAPANLTAGGAIRVDGGTLVRLGTAAAGSAVAITGDAIFVDTATAGTGALSLVADTGGVTLGTGRAGTTALVDAAQVAGVTMLTGGGTTTVRAGAAANVGAIASTGANVVVTGASATVGTATAATTLALTAGNGALSLGTGTAGGAATLSSSGATAITTGLTAASASLTAGGAATVASLTTTSGAATLTAASASIGTLRTATTFNGTTRTGDFTLGTGTAGGAATIGSAGTLGITTALTAASATLTAGGAAAIASLTTTTGAVDLTANAAAITTLNAATTFAGTTRTGDLALTGGTTGGTATFITGGTGDILVTMLSSGGKATFASARHARLGNIDARSGDVMVTATAGEVTGIGTGNANLSSATGQVTVAGGTLARLGVVNAATLIDVAADAVSTTTATARGGSLREIARTGTLSLGTGSATTTATLTATAGAATVGTLTAGGAATLTSGGAFTVTDRVTTGTTLALSAGGAADVGALTVGSAATLASGGAFTIANGTTTGTTFDLNAGGSARVGPLGVGSAAAITSGTSTELTGATAVIGTTFAINAGTTATVGTGGIQVGGATPTAANTLLIRSTDLALAGSGTTGIVRAGRITLIDRNTTGTTRLGDTTGVASGYALGNGEFALLVTPTLTIDATNGAAAHNVAIGTTSLTDLAGSARIDVLTTGRIDLVGTITGGGTGTAAQRVLRLGGTNTTTGTGSNLIPTTTPVDTSLASLIVATTDPSGGGRILLGGGTADGTTVTGSTMVDLRANRIAFGQTAGFLGALGLTGTGTGADFQTVANQYIAQPASTLYNAQGIVLGGGSTTTTAYTRPTILTASTLSVRYGDYALFQNTGTPTALNPTTGIVVNSLQAPTIALTSQGATSGANGQNGLALFGVINDRTGNGAALLGGTVIQTTAINPTSSRINGCLIGSGGGGCLISAVAPPQINVFDTSQANVFRTADDLAVQFDPVVGTNNEALFSDLGAIDFQYDEVQCDPATDASCAKDGGTDQ